MNSTVHPGVCNFRVIQWVLVGVVYPLYQIKGPSMILVLDVSFLFNVLLFRSNDDVPAIQQLKAVDT